MGIHVKDIARALILGYQSRVLGTMADTCRARQLLNFEARYDFVETMKEMVARTKAGDADYLAPMWQKPSVISAVEKKVNGWSRLSPLERSGKIKDGLIADPAFLDGILRDIGHR